MKKLKKINLKNPIVTAMFIFLPFCFTSCSSDDDGNDDDGTISNDVVIDVNPSFFSTEDGFVTVTTVPCTLSDGTETDCLQIVSQNTPTDHEMGPWCPEHITDGAEAGGLWFDNGELFDLDGAFIENLATFYGDDTWKMFDDDGNVLRITTQEECVLGANPQNADQFVNVCLQCLPSWIDAEETHLIPITPVMVDTPIQFGENAPPGQPNNSPVNRGIAFNGVKYDLPAALDIILGGYQLAPVDNAGGHINNAVGYHYHGDMGVSKQIAQTDDHAAMIGYALDGHGIFRELDLDGNEHTDLDDCRGHSDDIRGYHYHAAALADNNFIGCLSGAWVVGN